MDELLELIRMSRLWLKNAGRVMDYATAYHERAIKAEKECRELKGIMGKWDI